MKLAFVAFLATLTTAALASPPSLADRLTIHEWGTFTVLQDERGKAIGGINTDDEPVPPFVHSIEQGLIQSQSDLPPVYFKGVPQCDPSVIVRLETPVIYFHAPAGYRHAIDVDVAFRGGWLTQFYPDAQAEAPGLTGGNYRPGILSDQTVGKLSWHNLCLGTSGAGPRTSDPVWAAPRRVETTNITAANGESEKFIFYRGVGHVKSPLSVSRTADGKHFEVRPDFGETAQPDSPIGPLWLADVGEDGKIAVRFIPRVMLGNSQQALPIEAMFEDDQYSGDLTSLRRSMHKALVADGLYDDEADALLNTWEVSYFKRPGLRLFYLVPQEWTQQTLPLKLIESGHPGEPLSADIRRVMVGRVELVTPEQRQRLAQIASGPASDTKWLANALTVLAGGRDDSYREEWFKKLIEGRQSLSALHVQVPADYRAYLDLGRFRNALILDEAAHRPTPALLAFIRAYALGPS